MKNNTKTMNYIYRILSVALVMALVFTMLLQGVRATLAEPDEPSDDRLVIIIDDDDWTLTGTVSLAVEQGMTEDEPGDGNATESGEKPGDGSGAEPVGKPGDGSVAESGEEPGDGNAAGTGEEPRDGSVSETGENANENMPEVGTGSGSGSISGYIWIDGDGSLDTDWDGLHNGDEQLLPGLRVYLYKANDLGTVIASTLSANGGSYSFNSLEPGDYVLAVRGAQVAGVEYLAPVFATQDNKFAIDWSVSGLPAYTGIIRLLDGQAINGINAGMRLPMATAAYADFGTVAGLKRTDLKVNDTVFFDNRTWVVVRIVNGLMTDEGPIKAVYLVMRSDSYSNQKYGGSTNYATSDLRARMTKFLLERGNTGVPTARALALKADLGDFSSLWATTEPIGEMAGSETVDIFFAPSYRDMANWAGDPVKTNHPLHKNPLGGKHFPTRFWFRTPASTTGVSMITHFRETDGFDWGVSINGTTGIADIPGVWVNANAVDRDVIVNYIDTDGNLLIPPFTTTVLAGDAYTLPSGNVLSFPYYEYREWRVGIDGTAQSTFTNPNLAKLDVLDGKELYLVYEKMGNDEVTVFYVDTDGNPIGSPSSTTYHVPFGEDFTLTMADVPYIDDYEYIQWKIGAFGMPQNTVFPVPMLSSAEVIAGAEVYLIYTESHPVDVEVTVSKEVLGDYGDLKKQFEFTVYFEYKDGSPLEENREFYYVGDVAAGITGATAPGDGVLSLDGAGKDTFVLRHGQAITIQDVPSNVLIKVVERQYKNYTTIYQDSKFGGSIIDVEMAFDKVGADARTLRFMNIYTGDPPVIPMGIEDNMFELVMLPLLSIGIIASVMIASRLIRRRAER